MALDFLMKAAGNSASTTLSSGVTNTSTSLPLTSDTAFLAGGGIVIVDEGEATEELAYYTGKSGGALTVPLANRGLEGGSAQAHAAGATVKGVFSADMWNNAMEALLNLVVVTSGAVDGTKVMTITSGDAQLATGGNIQVNSADPYRSIVIPAGSMSPTTTAGCASVATGESTTNKVCYKYLAFDKDTDEKAFVGFTMPTSWDGGVINFRLRWEPADAAGAAETINFTLGGRSYGDDEAIDQAIGTTVAVSDTYLADADFHITDWSGDVTLAGTPAGGEGIYLELMRDVSADDLAGDAHIVDLIIRYKVAQYSD